jgi:hypothetical protein
VATTRSGRLAQGVPGEHRRSDAGLRQFGRRGDEVRADYRRGDKRIGW